MHKIKIKQTSLLNYALKAKEDKTNVNKGKRRKQSMKKNQMNTSHHLNHIGNNNYSKGQTKDSRCHPRTYHTFIYFKRLLDYYLIAV